MAAMTAAMTAKTMPTMVPVDSGSLSPKIRQQLIIHVGTCTTLSMLHVAETPNSNPSVEEKPIQLA